MSNTAADPTKTNAEIAKLQAETAEIMARLRREDEKARAEVAKLEAEREAEELRVRQSRILTERDEREEGETLAANKYHHVYYFTRKVDEASVSSCMDALTTWHRTSPGCEITIIFLSPGGSVIDGLALYDFIQDLRRSGHRITTGTQGYAASMAGVLLQAGDVRFMARNASILIHEISSLAWGKAGDIEDELEFIHKLQDRILGIFADRSGGKASVDFLRDKWKRKDWWLMSEEALELGLVDEIR